MFTSEGILQRPIIAARLIGWLIVQRDEERHRDRVIILALRAYTADREADPDQVMGNSLTQSKL